MRSILELPYSGSLFIHNPLLAYSPHRRQRVSLMLTRNHPEYRVKESKRTLSEALAKSKSDVLEPISKMNSKLS
jgi:hypothetical protein